MSKKKQIKKDLEYIFSVSAVHFFSEWGKISVIFNKISVINWTHVKLISYFELLSDKIIFGLNIGFQFLCPLYTDLKKLIVKKQSLKFWSLNYIAILNSVQDFQLLTYW